PPPSSPLFPYTTLFRALYLLFRVISRNRRLRRDRILLRVHDLVLAHLIQREVLLLHVDRIATFKRREVEPTPALVRGFDATANQLGRHVGLLALVHAEQRVRIQPDTPIRRQAKRLV